MQKVTLKGKTGKGEITTPMIMFFAAVIFGLIMIAVMFYGASGALASVHKSLKPVLSVLASAMAIIKG